MYLLSSVPFVIFRLRKILLLILWNLIQSINHNFVKFMRVKIWAWERYMTENEFEKVKEIERVIWIKKRGQKGFKKHIPLTQNGQLDYLKWGDLNPSSIIIEFRSLLLGIDPVLSDMGQIMIFLGRWWFVYGSSVGSICIIHGKRYGLV